MSVGDRVSTAGRVCDWCTASASESRVLRGHESGKSAGVETLSACGQHLHLLEPALLARNGSRKRKL